MKLTITGYSTALFSTWFFIDELALLFDAGDGVIAGLMQKSRKVKHVFVSHADRDHLTGLFQFNQLNAREGLPIIHYPKDCGSFPALAAFTSKFDPHVSGVVWDPIIENGEYHIKPNVLVRSHRNEHVVDAGERTKSLSYKVFETKRKLKSEFQELSGDELKKLRDEKGEAHMTELHETNVLSYSGDTPIGDPGLWDGSKVLIHEATFMNGEKDPVINPHSNKHSSIEEVFQMVADIKLERLILSHFSSRYSDEQIDDRIRKLCKEYAIKIPVNRVLPGRIHRNILNEEPINN